MASFSNSTSIIDLLKSKGIDSSFANRKKLAEERDIQNYTGTASQNISLIKKLNNTTPELNTPTQNRINSTPIYIIGISNPISTNERNYRQEITFTIEGSIIKVTTTFPNSPPERNDSINSTEGVDAFLQSVDTYEYANLAGTTLTNEFDDTSPDEPISNEDYEKLANGMLEKIIEAFSKEKIDKTFTIIEVIPPLPSTPPLDSIGEKVPTPLDIENTRKKEAEQIKSDNTKIVDVDLPAIENSTPESLKAKGNAKLSKAITALGKKIVIQLIPIAIDIVRKFITQIVENEIKKLKQKIPKEQQKIQDQIDALNEKIKNGVKGSEIEILIKTLTAKKEAIPVTLQIVEDNLRAQLSNFGSFRFNELPKQIVTILETVFADGCPNPNDSTIKELIATRNSLVTSLNIVGKQLNTLTLALTGLNTFLSISQTVIDALKTTKTATSLAVKTVPSPPGVPGVVTSTLSDLETVINKSTFEKDGTPRLPKIANSIASASLAISLVNLYIQQIVGILSALDIKLKQCAPDLAGNISNTPPNAPVFPGLTPISNDLISIAAQQTQADNTINQVTYAGFLIEIEEVPYTPTVNRRRAVGKNQSGIILVQTELSFTTQDLILINELKLIIDRDNLKAY